MFSDLVQWNLDPQVWFSGQFRFISGNLKRLRGWTYWIGARSNLSRKPLLFQWKMGGSSFNSPLNRSILIYWSIQTHLKNTVYIYTYIHIYIYTHYNIYYIYMVICVINKKHISPLIEALFSTKHMDGRNGHDPPEIPEVGGKAPPPGIS